MTRVLTTAATCAALVLTFASCSSSSSSGGGEDADEGDGYGAEVMCEEFVKDRLKSPGSAEFSEQTHVERNATTWDVTGVVDSENGFGALLRADYSCTMRYAGDDLWRARDVTLIPR